MNKLISFLIFMILAIVVVTKSAANDKDLESSERFLSVTQITNDLALLKEAYSRMHPGYTRYASEKSLHEALDVILEQAKQSQGLSIGDFYLAIQKWLTLIKCDHTKANLPKDLDKSRDVNPVYLPFRWVWLEGKAIITHLPDATLQAQISPLASLEKFDEVISIDGQSIQDMVEQVKQYIPYDGYTEWSRLSGLSESLEFKGGAIDHFGEFLWDISDTVNVVVKKLDGSINTITLNRINYQQWLTLVKDPTQAWNFKDAVTYQAINSKVGYIKVDTFVNYRNPVDVDDIYDPIFKQIKAQDHEVLIVDLRNNGGGSTDASRGLLANLINEKTKVKLDMFVNTLSFDDIVQHLWTWDKRALDPNRIAFSKNENGTYSLRSFFTEELDTLKPAKYGFEGKIIALTSNSNSSGSTNLLSVLHSERDILLIGEKTGGSSEGVTAGLLFTLTLPESKITTRLPFFRFKNNVSNFEKGLGLSPDIYAPMTIKALRENRDPSLEMAISEANKI